MAAARQLAVPIDMDVAVLGSIHIIQISARLPLRCTLKSPPGSAKRKVFATCALSMVAISLLVHADVLTQLGREAAATFEEYVSVLA